MCAPDPGRRRNPLRKRRSRPFSRPSQGYTRYVATVPTRFDRTPVDTAKETQPAGPAAALNDEERALLGDLFAVIEEHDSTILLHPGNRLTVTEKGVITIAL